MFQRTKLCAGIFVAFGGAMLTVSPVLAQETQRVEITGSSIKRIDAETALPVTVITRDQIEKSGLTTASDLIQALPSMQGFLTASNSVNGGGGGATNASLHSIGSAYTLVLLNGRRMAPYNTGTTINLESIPLSAVERVEVLTDGASAIYGADAIAGVVNFILKKNTSNGEVAIMANKPQHSGGESANFAVTKGFGDLDTDGFNVLLSIAGEKQKVLRANQRDFSKSGVLPFKYKGQNLSTYNTSSNSVPGTVILQTNIGELMGFYTPSLLETGKCGSANSFERNGVCRFDFAATVDNVPESERLSLFASGRLKINENHTLFGELVFSDFKNTPTFAAPAQPGIPLTQALYDKHVKPFLTDLGLTAADFAGVGDASGLGPSMNLRLADAGGRQDEYRTKTIHAVIGGEGSFGSIDYQAYFTHSENKFTDTLLSGYTSKNKLFALIDSGAFDPLSSESGTAKNVLAPAVLTGKLFDESKSSLDVLSARGSMPVAKLGGGDLAVGVGVEFSKQRYVDNPSDISMGNNALQPNFTDTPIGGSSGALPFDSTRNAKGLYAEIVAPVIKGLELSGAARFDSYDAVKNSRNFDSNGNPSGSASQGKSASSSTYKLSARFIPMEGLLIRGSIGTGFKPPTLASISNPIQAFGSTGFHSCPPGLAANLAAYCKPSSSEYNLRDGGNPNTDESGLSPEKSQQTTIGFRFEPVPALSFGVDLWAVKIKNRIDKLPEDVAFSDGATYGQFFSVLPDPVTGTPTLTLTQQPSNLGKARYMGLDFDVSGNIKTEFGKLSNHLAVTYMIKSDYEVSGLPGYQSSLGGYGPDTENTFRWLANFSTSLEMGSWTHTLGATFKPGYRDEEALADGSTPTLVRAVNADGTYGALQTVNRRVSAYAAFDWQTKYAFSKDLALTVGIRNLFDADPPFSIMALDGTGNMRGYDARYYSALGRQFYASMNFKF